MTAGRLLAQSVDPAGAWQQALDACALSYDDRFLRRKVIVTRGGAEVLVDLPQTTSLNAGDALRLTTGDHIEVLAAPEALYRVAGPDMARLAWHIGNRHTPCQITSEALLIQRDPVIRHMLDHLGAEVTEVEIPFEPEGGAYGHGRTHAHDHGHSAHHLGHNNTAHGG